MRPSPRSPLRRVAARLGAHGRREGEPRAAILLYHRIAEPQEDPFRLCVAPDRFEEHLEQVRTVYRVTTLKHVIAELAEPSGDGPHVAVTFDDGYRDNLDVAVPVASRLGVPLTVFVTVEPVASGERFWWDDLADRVLSASDDDELALAVDSRRLTVRVSTGEERARACVDLHGALRTLDSAERTAVLGELAELRPDAPLDDSARPLDVEELRVLAARPDVTIGSHTLTHPALTALAPEVRERELAGSKCELERLAGHPVELVSYPYGRGTDLDAEVVRSAVRAGYVAACTTVQRAVGSRSDRYALPRLTVADTSGEELLRRLRGVLPPR